MASPVDIFVSSDDAIPAPVADASVSVHNSVTKAMVAWGISEVDGCASFLLDPGIYEIRLFKLGVVFPKPVRIEVVDTQFVSGNTFDLPGTVLDLPISTDPATCRCTGRFVDASNRPMAGVTVRISPNAEQGSQVPEVVGGNQVLGGYARTLTTDQNGKVTVDLIRGGEFYVVWSGEDTDSWKIVVPDRPSVNLIDLIHPIPKSVAWDEDVAPGGVISVAVGETKEIPISILLSDFRTLTEGSTLCQLQNSNSDVAGADLSGGVVAVTGKLVGSSQVQVTRLPDATPVVQTQSLLLPVPLTVNVTP